MRVTSAALRTLVIGARLSFLAMLPMNSGVATAGPDVEQQGKEPAAASPLDAFPEPTQGTDDPLAAYRAALPALMQATDNKGCAKCFMDKYAPAEFNKAFAISRDGAFGGRWWRNLTLDQARDQALANCRHNKAYNAANPCFIFFENDEQVWQP